MLRKISTFLIMFVLFTMIGKAQWTYEGAWPDTNYKGGTHGIVVDPDGKIWTSSYYDINGGAGAGIPRILLVFSADGSTVDTLWTVTTGGVTDSLTGNTRGMGQDEDGNILITTATPSRIFKINYQTMEGMAKHDFTEIGSSPTAPAVSSDGTVFVGPVVGGGTSAIAMFSGLDLSFIGNAVLAPPNIARTMEVSNDGLSIYWTMFTGEQGIRIYSRPDEFSEFTFEDSVLLGMSIETAEWDPVTGYLWVSNDSRGLDSTYTHLTWYAYDPATNALVDSFTLPSPDPVPLDELPRGLAFSPDGSAAYVGLFGAKYDRLYKFSRPVDVKPDPNTVVSDYTLAQNYPNPFNPTTDIKFTVAKEGFVTLKVYDILGKEVAVLVNEHMQSGGYTADFNASELASGTYIYTLSVNGVSISKKMMLLK
jgi:DNA-binding beta-propeller fold protein YncE